MDVAQIYKCKYNFSDVFGHNGLMFLITPYLNTFKKTVNLQFHSR